MTAGPAWRRRASAGDVGVVVARLFAEHPAVRDERSIVLHDLDLMAQRFEELRRAFPDSTLHAVAVKANPVVGVLGNLVRLGAGLEAASLEEVSVALAAGCDPSKIVFDSPAKTREELVEALRLGATVNVDSVAELDRALDVRDPHHTARIGVRLNPAVGAGSITETSVGGADSRFGVALDEFRTAIVPRLAYNPLVQGIHVHVGSQGCSLDLLASAAETAASVRDESNHAAGRNAIRYVDIGGGLSTDYGVEAAAPTIDDYVELLRRRAPTLFDGDVRLITEFGRALLAGCGSAVTRVEYVKRVAGRDVAVVHLGADFLLRAAYAPETWRHRFSPLRADGGEATGPLTPYTIAGPLCFAGDVIGRGVELPELHPGDLVVVHDVGAYSISMWSRHCSRGLPAVIGHRDSSFHTLLAPERTSDVAAFWSRTGWDGLDG